MIASPHLLTLHGHCHRDLALGRRGLRGAGSGTCPCARYAAALRQTILYHGARGDGHCGRLSQIRLGYRTVRPIWDVSRLPSEEARSGRAVVCTIQSCIGRYSIVDNLTRSTQKKE